MPRWAVSACPAPTPTRRASCCAWSRADRDLRAIEATTTWPCCARSTRGLVEISSPGAGGVRAAAGALPRGLHTPHRGGVMAADPTSPAWCAAAPTSPSSSGARRSLMVHLEDGRVKGPPGDSRARLARAAGDQTYRLLPAPGRHQAPSPQAGRDRRARAQRFATWASPARPLARAGPRPAAPACGASLVRGQPRSRGHPRGRERHGEVASPARSASGRGPPRRPSGWRRWSRRQTSSDRLETAGGSGARSPARHPRAHRLEQRGARCHMLSAQPARR
jgi:hypothetical protein